MRASSVRKDGNSSGGKSASDSQKIEDPNAWPRRPAIFLTLVVLAFPYGAVIAGAVLVNPWIWTSMPLALTPCLWAATTQRLVRFMLTGDIQAMDRRAAPKDGGAAELLSKWSRRKEPPDPPLRAIGGS